MSAIVSTERLDFMWQNVQRMADHMRLLKARVKDLQDLRQSVDQSCANAITEGLKEVVQVVNWQFAALSRRILVIENRLGIPDDNVWCSVSTGAEVHCRNMLVSFPGLSLEQLSDTPAPYGILLDPMRPFEREEYPFLSEEELAALTPAHMEAATFGRANQVDLEANSDIGAHEQVQSPDPNDTTSPHQPYFGPEIRFTPENSPPPPVLDSPSQEPYPMESTDTAREPAAPPVKIEIVDIRSEAPPLNLENRFQRTSDSVPAARPSLVRRSTKTTNSIRNNPYARPSPTPSLLARITPDPPTPVPGPSRLPAEARPYARPTGARSSRPPNDARYWCAPPARPRSMRDPQK